MNINTKGFTPLEARSKGAAGAERALPRAGFTLIEALVAVTILTLATVGPLSSANTALVAAQSSRDKLTASYLAQEGVEYVRAIRDNAYLDAYRTGGANVSDTAWANFLSSAPSGIGICQGTNCSFDPTLPIGSGSTKALQVCTGSCSPLYLSASTNGYYTQDSSAGTETIFTRTIQVSATSPNEEKIVSKVSWDFHGTQHTVAVTETLTPWQ